MSVLGDPELGDDSELAPLWKRLDTLAGLPPVDAAEHARDALAPFMADGSWLPDRYRWVPPGREYAQYLLAAPADDSWCALAVVWAAEGVTAVHDHVVWGVSGQLEGQLVETRYTRLDGGDDAKPRLAAHSAVVCNPGEVSIVVPPHDVHRVANPNAELGVAIQLYGRNLTGVTRRIFDLVEGVVRPNRTVYDTPPGHL